MATRTSGDPQAERETEELTALRRRVAELERAVSGRDAFIARLAHELRQPLTPLALHLEHLKGRARREPMQGDHLAEELDVVERRVDRLTRLLNRIADVSRLGAGTFPLHPEWVDLGRIVRAVVQAHDWELEIARCEVRLDVAAGVCGVWDATGLAQIVTNLLTNAMKFGAGGEIAIAVESDHDDAVLQVRDHGIGINAAEQARIFECFTPAAPARDRPGLGVGLWVVAALCTALGGSVRVESEPGAGATFTVRLPRRGASR